RARVHFEALKKRYNVISLRQYVDARHRGRAAELPPRALVITIDDGHRSNYGLKAVLEALGIPVTIFLCSGVVGTHRRFWFRHPLDPEMKERIKRLSDTERLAVLEGHGFAETREYPERQALSDAEIEQMKQLVDFQAHTIFHPCLPRCTEARVRR